VHLLPAVRRDHGPALPELRRRAGAQAPAGRAGMTPREELIATAEAWDRVMVENDAAAIGEYMTGDWTIVGSDGSVGDKATFLRLIASGALSHDIMESHDMDVRIYGDTAVIVARGVSGGQFQGRPFREVERASCVFVRQDGRWRCVLTHLSRLAPQDRT
jgi:ketosteroid isomerase-like protein